jgi:hypothetical protein
MVVIADRQFRAWVSYRFDSMAEDPDWQRDNPSLVPQARRIAYAATKGEPIYIEDVKVIVEEIVSFEDSLKEGGEWTGAKRFLIDSGSVHELTEEEASMIVVTRGRPEWFRHNGKMYI